MVRGKWANSLLAERQAATAGKPIASRFSIYPKTTSAQSLKATIKRAVSGIGGLGLEVQADDVSSIVTGSASAVFEGMEGVLARAASVEGKPHVSMQFTLSSNAPDVELPARTDDADGWAVSPPARVAAQFAVYSICELGTCTDAVDELASQSPSFVAAKDLCVMLDGEGSEVFSVLRESFELACGRSISGHVVLTATITANKASWKTDEQRAADAAAVADAAAMADAARVSSAEALQALMSTRRTVNELMPTLPDAWEAALERAITAAIYAPNHKRTEPWRFHLLGPKAVHAVCELNAQLVREAGKGDAAADKKLNRWLAMPGWLVVTRVRAAAVVDDDDLSMLQPNGRAREDYAAVCCAIQNLCLSLHADGLGTKWTSGPVNFDPRFAEAAGLPADEEVCGTIWFGTPAGPLPQPPTKRLSVADVLRRSE